MTQIPHCPRGLCESSPSRPQTTVTLRLGGSPTTKLGQRFLWVFWRCSRVGLSCPPSCREGLHAPSLGVRPASFLEQHLWSQVWTVLFPPWIWRLSSNPRGSSPGTDRHHRSTPAPEWPVSLGHFCASAQTPPNAWTSRDFIRSSSPHSPELWATGGCGLALSVPLKWFRVGHIQQKALNSVHLETLFLFDAVVSFPAFSVFAPFSRNLVSEAKSLDQISISSRRLSYFAIRHITGF